MNINRDHKGIPTFLFKTKKSSLTLNILNIAITTSTDL